jgi:hypothetical protein
MLHVVVWVCPKCHTPHDHLPWCCLICTRQTAARLLPAERPPTAGPQQAFPDDRQSADRVTDSTPSEDRP